MPILGKHNNIADWLKTYLRRYILFSNMTLDLDAIHDSRIDLSFSGQDLLRHYFFKWAFLFSTFQHS